MSESGSPTPDQPEWFQKKRSRPARPDWFRGKTRPPRPRAKPGPKSKSTPEIRHPTTAAPSEPPRPLNVDPADAEWHEPTIGERLQREMKAGASGMAVSFALHAAVLMVMALIVYQFHQDDPDVWIDAGWDVSSAAAQNNRARGPVDVGAIKLDKDAPSERIVLDIPKEQTGNQGDEDAPPSTGFSPVDVKNLLANRNLELREQMLAEHGGDEQTEAAIRQALLWLKRQQRSGGNWLLHDGYADPGQSTLKTDTGATALALLAFLGAGQTHRRGDHQETVRKGLDWLIKTQKPTGNYHDRYDEGHQTAFYAHSQAVIVMCEAFALTGDESLRESAQKGVDFLAASENPALGGWKYRPADEKTIGDLSVTGWALMALHTARAAGLSVPKDALIRAGTFLNTVSEQNGTRYKYMPGDPADRVTAAMTAEGLLCRQFLGERRDSPKMQAGVEYLLAEVNRPLWKNDRRNVYEWYYTAQVLHNLGGEPWKSWYAHVNHLIVVGQKTTTSKRSGDIRGSWDPLHPRGAYHEYAAQAGRLYLTVMCTLILESPYRHKPIYDTPPKQL